MEHWPALADAVIEILEPKSGGIYFDGTVGEGGHAEAILKKSGPEGRLIGADVDPQAIDSARRRLGVFPNRVTLVQANYREIREILDAGDTHVQEAGSCLADTWDRGGSGGLRLLRPNPSTSKPCPTVFHPTSYPTFHPARHSAFQPAGDATVTAELRGRRRRLADVHLQARQGR